MRVTRPRNGSRTTPSWKTPPEMPDVLILVGSESDKPRIEPAFDILTKAGFSYEFYASSAHRQPEQTGDLVKNARKKGFKVVIAGAGLLAALLATVQVPPGVPVATVGIDNAKNAAHLAIRILKG